MINHLIAVNIISDFVCYIESLLISFTFTTWVSFRYRTRHPISLISYNIDSNNLSHVILHVILHVISYTIISRQA